MFASLIPQPLYQKVSGWFGGERNLAYAVAGAAAAVGLIKLSVYIKKQNRRKKWNAVGKDVVVLHTMQRGRFLPSLSPYALKLETYLRLANIPYQVDYSEPMGPKGKMPWITLNGKAMGDSQLIIEFLGRKYGKDLSSHLTSEQKGIALAMRVMTEEHFIWCWELNLFLKTSKEVLFQTIKLSPAMTFLYSIMFPLTKKSIRKVTYYQGLGRHTMEEVEDIGKKDILALSSWLGNKNFFTGDKPTEVDCAIFGFLAQLVWNLPNSVYGRMLGGECSNLKAFCLRMKEKIWPDWNEFLDPPQPATSS